MTRGNVVFSPQTRHTHSPKYSEAFPAASRQRTLEYSKGSSQPNLWSRLQTYQPRKWKMKCWIITNKTTSLSGHIMRLIHVWPRWHTTVTTWKQFSNPLHFEKHLDQLFFSPGDSTRPCTTTLFIRVFSQRWNSHGRLSILSERLSLNLWAPETLCCHPRDMNMTGCSMFVTDWIDWSSISWTSAEHARKFCSMQKLQNILLSVFEKTWGTFA